MGTFSKHALAWAGVSVSTPAAGLTIESELFILGVDNKF